MKFDYSKIFEKFTEKGKQNFFVILGIAGVVLISLGNLEFNDVSDSKNKDIYLQEYRKQIENEITSLLKEINGVGDVKVMITLQSGEENVYAEQEKKSEDTQTNQTSSNLQASTQSSYENEIVIVKEQNDNKPLLEKTLLPEIQGVAVVCSGGDDISVISAVTNSVSVVLNVPTNRIFVAKMK